MEHQTLLGGYPGIPTSAAHLADQMESGGARVEETLSRFNCRYQTLFFSAGMAVALGAAIGFIDSIFHLRVTNAVNSLYLICFGVIMMMLDVPGNPRWANKYRLMVRKYCRFLTRLVGKAAWFLFLGSLTTITLWPKRGSTPLILIGGGAGLFVIVVAIMGLLIAIRKSLRLEKVRKAVNSMSHGASVDVYRKYCMTDASHGMQIEEFNRMCADYTSGKLQFDVADLQIIYNALDGHLKGAINEREFSDWMNGSMTYV